MPSGCGHFESIRTRQVIESIAEFVLKVAKNLGQVMNSKILTQQLKGEHNNGQER
jgi:hypothetical protein